MGKQIKKLGEAELEIMQVIWNSDAPVSSSYILKNLGGRKWRLSTLMTSLSRLSDKGFVVCDRSTGNNLYTAIVSEDGYKAKESKHFLERLYDSSLQNLVATLYGNQVIQASDLAELRKFLDEIDAKHSEEGT
ncbi:MAG: BlaI/MecI/CopY family transcriptional regulator [Candidatus Gastranaerophilales bacterium]|nr:BlaI/MecI/CopY family transcriptional regulator [Candidatus Gastranaerophilales bacterium]